MEKTGWMRVGGGGRGSGLFEEYRAGGGGVRETADMGACQGWGGFLGWFLYGNENRTPTKLKIVGMRWFYVPTHSMEG